MCLQVLDIYKLDSLVANWPLGKLKQLTVGS